MPSSKDIHQNTQLISNEPQRTESLKKARKLVKNHGTVPQPKEIVEENSGKSWSPLSRMGSFKRRSARRSVHLAPLYANPSQSCSFLDTASSPSAKLSLVPRFRPPSLQRTSLFSSPSPSKCPPAKSTASPTLVDIDKQSVVSPSSFVFPIPDLGQLQKDRVAKLSRHLGENISPELVSRCVRDDIAISSGEKHKCRQSLDLSLTPGHSSVKRSPERMEGAMLKRSRSMLARKGHMDDLENDFQKRYDRNFGLHRTMSERQRLLHVKRARKMTQVFGQEPPQELIQFVDKDKRSLRQGDRDSTSTLLSFTSNPIPPSSPEPPLQLASSNLSDPPATLVTPDHQRFPSLPPFSWESQSPIEDGVATFGERRRRAAKLSRFFGVTYKDLASYAPSTRDVKPQAPEPPSVDVQVIGPSGFWGDVSVQDAQLADVISQLRELKAG